MASGFRLPIRSATGRQYYDTGVIRVARRFVEGLPLDRMLRAILTAVCSDRTLDRRFWSSKDSSSESEAFRAALRAVV